jgi:hypothetical protein
MFNASVSYTYRQARKLGYTAKDALRIAKIVERFQWLEYEDRVRLRYEDEDESYFDVYGEPDGYTDIYGRRISAEQAKQQIIDSIERNGNYWITSEVYNPETEEWEHADSIGMCSGYNNVLDPLENCYVPDLMAAAIDWCDEQDNIENHNRLALACWCD